MKNLRRTFGFIFNLLLAIPCRPFIGAIELADESVPGLKRQLGLFQATMYGVGLILGAGIYVLIGQAVGTAGNSIWISFLLAALISAFTGLSYAELASMFPRAAAEYVYVKNAFRSDFLAFIVGWLILSAAVLAAATIALGFSSYLAYLTGTSIVVGAVGLIVLLSLINFYGIRESSWFNVVFTLIEAAGLVIIIILGAVYSRGPIDYLEAPNGVGGILDAIALAFFAYIGFENIANIAEETKNPKTTLPRALILSMAVTSIIYLLVSLAVVRILDWRELASSSAPLALLGGRVLGPSGEATLAFIALFAATNTVLILLIASSRILFGMAEEGSLPTFLTRVHSSRGTPWIAAFVVMLAVALLAYAESILTVANVTILTIVVIFALVNLSLIILRYTEPNRERPFRVPGRIGWFPILPALGFATSLAGALQFEVPVLFAGLAVITLGITFHTLLFEK